MLEPIAVRRVAHPPHNDSVDANAKDRRFRHPPPQAKPAIAISGILVPYLLLCPLLVRPHSGGATRYRRAKG